jgi:photosystem II stability/assembly factor-like uncharacterized protein
VSFQYLTFVDENDILGGTSSSSLNGGNIYLSTDGGQTWNKKVQDVANIQKIMFLNDQLGFTVGGATGAGTTMYLGKTMDCGKTWDNLSANFKNSIGSPITDIPLYDLWVVNSDMLYVISSSQLIYLSIDGGKTWNQAGSIQAMNPDYGYIFGNLHRNLQFVSTVDGFVSSYNSLFRTRDNGSTWERLTSPWNYNQKMELKGLKFLDANNGWALVVDNETSHTQEYGSYLYMTNNGGQSWSLVYQWDGITGYYPSESLYVKNLSEMWVGGWEEIWHSVDGWLYWILENQGSENRKIWGFQIVGSESVARAIASTGLSDTSITGYYKHSPTNEVITTPTKPGGEENGAVGISYTYSTGGAYSDLGHSVQYFFDWGDGTNSGWLAIGATSASKFWDSIGIYTVKAKARCYADTSVESSWSSSLSVTISTTTAEIITTPATPSGPKTGTQGISYSYSTSGSYSDLGHSVQYFFDWGDGSNSGWLPIGATNASQSWTSIGIYTVKAQARCATDTSVISSWSSGLPVAIGSSCTSWSDVISKYNAYVAGTATWTDVIETYNQYVSNPC